MVSNLKSNLIGISFLLVLAGCQTTNTAITDKTVVPCSSQSFDFLHAYNQYSVCLTFDYPQNATVERTVNFSNERAIFLDLISYNSNVFFEKAKKKFLSPHTFNLEHQITSSAKNADNKEAKQFLTNMKFKFQTSDEAKQLAVWSAKSYANGKTYHGYAFVKLFTVANKKYQFAGFFMEISNTPTTRERFETALDSFEFRGEINSDKTHLIVQRNDYSK
ncbi:MAG: hypothetical protein V7727_04790 [Sneathiella sp.]